MSHAFEPPAPARPSATDAPSAPPSGESKPAGADGSSAARKSLGLAACTGVVVGNMVGSGFYLSPSAVAPYGLLAVVMWVVMGAGAVCLGLAFARLAPATGGPYAYTRLGYGDFAGFLVAWGYWVSIWASLPAIALAFAGAIVNVLPMLRTRPMAWR
jgi:basic amino acid/polyamine antiporter, APA family